MGAGRVGGLGFSSFRRIVKHGGRPRVSVRIRIFRISLRPTCDSRHNRNPAKTNTDERLPVKDETVESCKSYNPENPDSDKMPSPASPFIGEGWDEFALRAGTPALPAREPAPISQTRNSASAASRAESPPRLCFRRKLCPRRKSRARAPLPESRSEETSGQALRRSSPPCRCRRG